MLRNGSREAVGGGSGPKGNGDEGGGENYNSAADKANALMLYMSVLSSVSHSSSNFLFPSLPFRPPGLPTTPARS